MDYDSTISRNEVQLQHGETLRTVWQIKSARHKGQILYDSTYGKLVDRVNSERQSKVVASRS